MGEQLATNHNLPGTTILVDAGNHHCVLAKRAICYPGLGAAGILLENLSYSNKE